jgi:4-diphosphocytidyl-2-C-methyl-D-erythritol kinase
MSVPGRAVTVTAHAKLTLSLRVTGVRDDGFHDLEALTVSVDEPRDELTVRHDPGRSGGVDLAVRGPFAAQVGPFEENLVVRAAVRFLEGFAYRGGIDLELHKGIPVGAGLGGGSADAAAAFVALRALFDADVPDRVLAALGSELGSDVPFCVRGGAAWMRGRGEDLEPVEVPELYALIAAPPFGCSTPAVYRAWDDLGGPRAHRLVEHPGLPPLGNDLEPAAEHVEPRLPAFRAAVEAATRRRTVLAGSGSAYAALFGATEGDAAHAAADALRAAVDAQVFLGRTAAAGVAPA